jgi:mannan endo-1,4-beta-mannosidase
MEAGTNLAAPYSMHGHKVVPARIAVLKVVPALIAVLVVAGCTSQIEVGTGAGRTAPDDAATAPGASPTDGSAAAPRDGGASVTDGAPGPGADATAPRDGGASVTDGAPEPGADAAPSSDGGGGTAQTANPNASTDARKVLAYLESLRGKSGKHVISGQEIAPDDASQLGDMSHYLDGLYTQTGKYPAFVEFGLGSGQSGTGIESPSDMQLVAQAAINWWNAGGLVGMFASLGDPVGGGTGSSLSFSSADAHDLITPGTAINATFLGQLDRLAAALETLQQAGVVVLWRPLHEMNGFWNWWSMGDGGGHIAVADFVAIWRYYFDYFTSVKHLNNLLWVYGPNAAGGSTSPVDTFFPGAAYVDISGVDLYDANVGLGSDNYNRGRALTKSFGLNEFGPGFSSDGSFNNQQLIEILVSQYPDITFFKYWTSWSGANEAIVDNANATGLMNHPAVITRSDLAWR